MDLHAIEKTEDGRFKAADELADTVKIFDKIL
jgi:hypothetical protein